MFVDYVTGQLGAHKVRGVATPEHGEEGPHGCMGRRGHMGVLLTIHRLRAQDMEFCSNIVRVIIAGNAVTDKPAKATTTVRDTKVESMFLLSHTHIHIHMHTHTLTHADAHINIFLYFTVSVQTKYLSKNYSADTIDAMKELDDMLAQLAVSLPSPLPPSLHPPTLLPSSPCHLYTYIYTYIHL